MEPNRPSKITLYDQVVIDIFGYPARATGVVKITGDLHDRLEAIEELRELAQVEAWGNA